MSQNGQTHFKNLAAFAATVSDHFGTLCIKGLKACRVFIISVSSICEGNVKREKNLMSMGVKKNVFINPHHCQIQVFSF